MNIRSIHFKPNNDMAKVKMLLVDSDNTLDVLSVNTCNLPVSALWSTLVFNVKISWGKNCSNSFWIRTWSQNLPKILRKDCLWMQEEPQNCTVKYSIFAKKTE